MGVSRRLKEDALYKKIMQTNDAFVKSDDFAPDEVLRATVNEGKFLIRWLLNDYKVVG